MGTFANDTPMQNICRDERNSLSASCNFGKSESILADMAGPEGIFLGPPRINPKHGPQNGSICTRLQRNAWPCLRNTEQKSLVLLGSTSSQTSMPSLDENFDRK